MDVCITRFFQTSGRLVQDLNVSIVCVTLVSVYSILYSNNGHLIGSPVRKVSCMKKSWHEHFIFMHENMHEIFTHENINFAPEMILWIIGLYIISCLGFSPIKDFGQKKYFPAWKLHFPL